jgi:hypothetical protein
VRKRHLAAAAAVTFSFTALSQTSAFAAGAPAGTLLRQVITNEQAGWAEPAGSTGITQGSITALPNGSSQFVEVTSAGVLEHNILEANGSWQGYGWGSPAGSTGISQAAITALPNGSSEIVVASSVEAPVMGIRYSSGSWDTNWTQLYESPAYDGASDASIAGMPNGNTQVIEVAQSAS